MMLTHPYANAVLLLGLLSRLLCCPLMRADEDVVAATSQKKTGLTFQEIAVHLAEPIGARTIPDHRWKTADEDLADALVATWVAAKDGIRTQMLINASDPGNILANQVSNGYSERQRRIRDFVARTHDRHMRSIAEQTRMAVRLEDAVKRLGPVAIPALVRYGQPTFAEPSVVIETLQATAGNSQSINQKSAQLYLAVNYPLVECPELSTAEILQVAMDDSLKPRQRSKALRLLVERRDDLSAFRESLTSSSIRNMDGDLVAVLVYLDGDSPATRQWLLQRARGLAYYNQNRSRPFLQALVGLAIKHPSTRDALGEMLASKADEFSQAPSARTPREKAHVLFRTHLAKTIGTSARHLRELAPDFYHALTDGAGKRYGYEHKAMRRELSSVLALMGDVGFQYLIKARAAGVKEAAAGLAMTEDEDIENVIDQLANKNLNWEERIDYYGIIEGRGPEAAAAAPLLKQHLHEVPFGSKLLTSVVDALAATGSDGREYLVKYFHELYHAHPGSAGRLSREQYFALDNLEKCVPESRRFYDILKKNSHLDISSNVQVSLRALSALANADESLRQEIVDLATTLLASESHWTEAASALQRIGPQAKSAVPALRKTFVDDPNMIVGRALAKISPVDAHDVFTDEKNYERLPDYSRKEVDEMVFKLAVEARAMRKDNGSQSPSSDAVNTLVAKLRMNQDVAQTLTLLAKHGESALAARDLLDRGLERSSHPELAARCASTLLTLDPGHQRARELLSDYRSSPEWHIRIIAWNAEF